MTLKVAEGGKNMSRSRTTGQLFAGVVFVVAALATEAGAQDPALIKKGEDVYNAQKQFDELWSKAEPFRANPKE